MKHDPCKVLWRMGKVCGTDSIDGTEDAGRRAGMKTTSEFAPVASTKTLQRTRRSESEDRSEELQEL